MGSPDAILTRAMLREAFDLDIEMKRDDSGRAYIRYENNLFEETPR